MIEFDETEFQDGLTAWALDCITRLYGAEMAELLDPEVVPIDVDNRGHTLRSDLLRTS